jgi:hypothetical protein
MFWLTLVSSPFFSTLHLSFYKYVTGLGGCSWEQNLSWFLVSRVRVAVRISHPGHSDISPSFIHESTFLSWYRFTLHNNLEHYKPSLRTGRGDQAVLKTC